MGDVHPHALKAELARELSRLTFERWSRLKRPRGLNGKTIFCNSGFEAVEAALKTARLATGKRGVLAFEGGYHGLGYGTLNATHRAHFRNRFLDQIGGFGQFVPFPCAPDFSSTHLQSAASPNLADCLSKVTRVLRSQEVGVVIVEPIQGRGGVRIPAAG